jgi:hypothetical protein
MAGIRNPTQKHALPQRNFVVRFTSISRQNVVEVCRALASTVLGIACFRFFGRAVPVHINFFPVQLKKFPVPLCREFGSKPLI